MVSEIIIDPALCLACGSCELACALRHGPGLPQALPHGEPLPRPRVRVRPTASGAFPLLCRHCQWAPCLDACPAGALERRDGLVCINEERCVGCWSCVMVCPTGAVLPSSQASLAHKCHGCPDEQEPVCVAACPTGALSVGREGAPSLSGHRRQELARRLARLGDVGAP